MKKIYFTIAMALLLPLTSLAQGWPANYGGVMLQGFFWDSYKETPDCSPFGPWQYHQTSDVTKSHQPGYTWATMYGAGWGSAEEWQVPVTTWSSLLAHKDEITPFIDLLWLPQSGSTVADSTTVYYTSNDNSGRGGVRPWRNGQTWGYGDGAIITNPDCMGFVPVFYFHHGLSYNPDGTPWTYTDSKGHVWTPMSYFGTEAELRELIATYKAAGTGAIEDVVANHRGGLGTWSDDKNSIEFPTEYYKGTFCPEGEYIQWTSDDVCRDDESGRGTGNYDCGGKGEWARDIDHHAPATQQKVIKFLDYLKNDLGYVGFRYDYAMGFEEKHFAEYNTTLRPTFSVGEYWGSKDNISSWIHKTYMEGTYQSAAFDFPLQSDIREAFNYGNYRYLNNSGLISDPVLKRYAVTFLDNHDTFKDLPTDGSNYNWGSGKAYNHRVEKNIVEANAFILAMPGTPCLFYPHFMHPQWHDILCLLIKARRTAGITNESERSAAELKGENGIQWIVTGNNGQVCYQLGDATDAGAPEGFTTVWESGAVDGKRVARYSITSGLYSQIESNEKKPLINGYPVIDRNNCTFTGSITVNVKPSSEGCKLVFTTNGIDPQPSDNTITTETALTFSETTTLKVGVLVDGAVPHSSIVNRQYVKTSAESDKINFYVKDDNAPYFYVYYTDNNGTTYQPLGGWRGYRAYEQVQVGGLNWWHVQMDKPAYPVNLIINWEGSQTPDITGITSDVFYTVKDGQPNDVTSTYLPMIENPGLSIDKPTGSYQGGVTATITSTYGEATIVYTTDGTEPTVDSPTIQSGESKTFSTTGNHYLRAGIVKDGQVINQVARSYFIENGTTTSGVNIFVRNMTTSEAPHILAWKDDNTLTSAFSQGGDVLTETVTDHGQTWYKKHFDQVPSGILFLLTGAENQPSKDQTADITGFEADKDYYFYYYPGAHFGDRNFQPGYINVTNDSRHSTDTKAITVFMYANQWSNNLKLYTYADSRDIFWAWTNSWAESAFPSVTLNGQQWYYCTFLGKENIGAIVYNGANTNERCEYNNVKSDIFIKFPKWEDNWSGGGDNLTNQYAQYLPQVQTAETVAVIPSCATAVDGCQYFYFENDSFGSPYAWVYSGTNHFGEHGWPGEALVDVVGTAPNGNLIYRWTYNSDQTPSNVIFSNNGQSQTSAFEFVNGGYYTSEGLQGTATGNIKTLAEVLKNGEVNQNYTISNDIVAVYTDQKGYKHIFAKDADGEALDLSTNPGGKKIHPTMTDWTYDQSNWVEIVLPAQLNSNNLQLFDDKSLLGQTIVGKLVDKVNPRIEVVANPLPTSKETGYNENQYVAANFMPADYTPNAGYFLVAPKPQEHAIIHWAVYEGNGIFTMPEKNAAGTLDVVIKGKFALAAEQPYFDMANTTIAQTLQVGHVYDLDVIVKRKVTRQGAPRLMEESDVSNIWEVAVVKVTETAPDVNVITPISTVDAGREVARVRYYNLMGVESDRPFQGVNIIVKEYTDGTRSTTKVIR